MGAEFVFILHLYARNRFVFQTFFLEITPPRVASPLTFASTPEHLATVAFSCSLRPEERGKPFEIVPLSRNLRDARRTHVQSRPGRAPAAPRSFSAALSALETLRFSGRLARATAETLTCNFSPAVLLFCSGVSESVVRVRGGHN